MNVTLCNIKFETKICNYNLPWLTVIKGEAPANWAISVPLLHGDITLAGGTPVTGATPVLSAHWTVIKGAAPKILAIPVPLLFWRLFPVTHLFLWSSIDWTTVFCIYHSSQPKALVIRYESQKKEKKLLWFFFEFHFEHKQQNKCQCIRSWL